jgi:hypothetical protein
MRSLPVERPTLDDPIYSQKNPYQTFLLALSIISSMPLLRGETSSATLAHELGHFTVIAWGVCLLVGSSIVLIGELWPGHTWVSLAIERAGLIPVSAGAGIYSAVVWINAGNVNDVRFIAGVTFAYAASCAWRCIQITRRLRWIRALVAEVNQAHES